MVLHLLPVKTPAIPEHVGKRKPLIVALLKDSEIRERIENSAKPKTAAERKRDPQQSELDAIPLRCHCSL
jgi:stalled ribosome alternative rescue factor ArfA